MGIQIFSETSSKKKQNTTYQNRFNKTWLLTYSKH